MATDTKSKSSNPAFRFADYDAEGRVAANSGVTNVGVMAWSFLYIAIMCATGAWAWTLTYPYASVEGTQITSLPPQVWELAITGMFGGLVVGLIIGTISAAFESTYPGIILNTALSTIGVFATVAFLYGSGIVKVNETFKMVLLSAMSAILLVYIADILLSIFAGYNFPMIHEQGNWWAIGFSVIVIIVAGLNFAWDFDNVRVAQEQGAPKYYEAYLAFGFMLTLVWLYMEVLRLWALSKKD